MGIVKRKQKINLNCKKKKVVKRRAGAASRRAWTRFAITLVPATARRSSAIPARIRRGSGTEVAFCGPSLEISALNALLLGFTLDTGAAVGPGPGPALGEPLDELDLAGW